jgi:hypothetical protein
MTTQSRLALLSALAATPAFAAPFLAIGDNAELFLTLRSETRYEDNLTFASGGRDTPTIQDTIFDFAPGLELNFGKSSLTKGSIAYSQRFTTYTDHSDLNEVLADLFAKSTYEGSKLRLDLNFSFNEQFQNNRDLAGTGASLIRSDVYTVGGNAEVSITQKSKVGVGVQYDSTQYIGIADGLLDRETYVVPVNYYFAVQPKLDLSLGVQYRGTQVNISNNDSMDVYVNVGARGEFTPKLLGSFSVGFNSRSGEAANSDSDGIGLKAALTYVYTQKTQFTLDASNDFGTGASGGRQERASLSLGARSKIAEELTTFASLGLEQTSFQGFDRDDTFISARLGVSYTFNKYLTFDGSYSHFNNASAGKNGNADFDANIVSIAANIRY